MESPPEILRLKVKGKGLADSLCKREEKLKMQEGMLRRIGKREEGVLLMGSRFLGPGLGD